jgi:hypothetical protein
MARVMPRVLSGLVAAALAQLGNAGALRAVGRGAGSRWLRTSHAGRPVSLTEGPVAVAAAVAGALIAGSAPMPPGALATAVIGSGLVGAYDDLYGEAQAKGLRGHFRALREGRLTSGMVKVAGIGLSAVLAARQLARRRPPGSARWLDTGLDAALIAGAANLTNLFDLRPGRAAKVVTVTAAPLWSLGSAPILGAALGSLPTDLGERAMLGDCGANALGAGVGVVAAAGLPRSVRAGLLAAVVSLTLLSERVSFTAVIDRNPVLRRLDRLGRRPGPADARP